MKARDGRPIPPFKWLGIGDWSLPVDELNQDELERGVSTFFDILDARYFARHYLPKR
jgi:hypothetical protein